MGIHFFLVFYGMCPLSAPSLQLWNHKSQSENLLFATTVSISFIPNVKCDLHQKEKALHASSPSIMAHIPLTLRAFGELLGSHHAINFEMLSCLTQHA